MWDGDALIRFLGDVELSADADVLIRRHNSDFRDSESAPCSASTRVVELRRTGLSDSKHESLETDHSH